MASLLSRVVRYLARFGSVIRFLSIYPGFVATAAYAERQAI